MSILINKIKANNVFLKGNNISQVFLKSYEVFPDEEKIKDYLYLNIASNTTITIYNYETRLNLEYSYDLQTWYTFSESNGNKYISNLLSNKVYFRGNCDTWTDLSKSTCPYFSFNGSIGGNIMSLIYGDDFEGKTDLTERNVSFKSIFSTRNVQDISDLKLPATKLSPYCYSYMFGGCINLKEIPANLLPATTVSNYGYEHMFDTCTSLTSLPANLLPATTVNTYGYSYMFSNCTSLEEVNFDLPSANLYDSAYRCMFYMCSSLTKAPNILSTVAGNVTSNGIGTITTYAQWLCSSMFRDCTSLVNQPTISFVGKIGSYAFAYMFNNCTSLVQVNLKATTLSENCYNYMLQNCTSLKTIYTNQSVAPSSTYSYNWLSNANNSGAILYKHYSWTVSSRNNHTIPSNWTIKSF